MGPKESRDPYSGSGEAAGALGHPGNVNTLCISIESERTWLEAGVGTGLWLQRKARKFNSFNLKQKKKFYFIV